MITNTSEVPDDCSQQKPGSIGSATRREVDFRYLENTGRRAPRWPKTKVQPHIWKWVDIYEGLVQARDEISLESGMVERRTLRLVNPDEWCSCAKTLWPLPRKRSGRISLRTL